MKLEPAEPLDNVARTFRCECGRLAPEPGYAPIGAYLAHAIKYHDPQRMRVMCGLDKPAQYCVKCRLSRVATEGESCVACTTELLRREQLKELQAKPVTKEVEK